MSRINDALKRASRAQQKNPPPSLPRLLPVESRPGSVIGWILPGVVGFLIIAACLFTGLALATRTVTTAAGESKSWAAQPVRPVATPAPDRVPSPIPVTRPAPASMAPSSPPPAPPPEPRLQGIVFAPTRPWAIVNGKTVRVGDWLGEFRVKAISPRGVVLEKADGSQKKLGLGN
jgi:hypothetical protein